MTINRWFVSATFPRQQKGEKLRWAPRQTKGFSTETEAKQFAKAMLSVGRYVTAGTVSPHYPIRRIVAANEVYGWVDQEG